MSAFEFRFGKKKPVDFSKMKNNLTPKNGNDNKPEAPLENTSAQEQKESPMTDKMNEIVKDKPLKPKGPKKKLSLKMFIIIILVIIFMAALLFTLGPKHAPKLMDKIGATKIMESIPFLKQEKDELLLTPEEQAIEELVTVRAYRVVRGDFIDVLPGMGTIKGDREVELRFESNGIVAVSYTHLTLPTNREV